MKLKIVSILCFLGLASFISVAAEPPKYDTLKIDVEDKRFSIPVDYCHNKEDKTVFIAGVSNYTPATQTVSNLNFFKLNYKSGNIQYEWQKRYETAKFTSEAFDKIEGFNFNHNRKGVMYCNEEGGFNLVCSMENKRRNVPTVFSFDANGNLLYENKDADAFRFSNEHFCEEDDHPVYILNADKSVYSIFKNYNVSKNTTYPNDLVYIHTDAQGNFIAKERIIDFLDNSTFSQMPNFFSASTFDIQSNENLVYDKDSNMYVLAMFKYYVSNQEGGGSSAGPEMILLKFDKNFKLQWSKFGHELVNSSIPIYTVDTLCSNVSNIDFTQDGNLLIIVEIYSKEAKRKIERHILKLSSSTGEIIAQSPPLEEISEYLPNTRYISYNTGSDGYIYLYTTFQHYIPEYETDCYKYGLVKLNPNLKDTEWIIKDDKHLVDLDTSSSSLNQFIELEPGHLLFTGKIANQKVYDPKDDSKIEKPMLFLLEIFDDKGIAEPIALERFISYPNPASDKFTVQANFLTFVSNVSISVNDITGRVVKQVFSGSSISGEFSHTFSTSDLSNGVYNVVLSFDGKEQSEKLIIKR